MNDHDRDNSSNFDDDGGEDLVWNEFDWEEYLREQDDVVHRFLGFYEHHAQHPERLDQAARCMGWDLAPQNADDTDSLSGARAGDDDDDDEDDEFGDDPYTLLKNYIYIATKAIYLSLTRSWEFIADKPARVPQPLALAFLRALHAGEANAMLGIQAVDFGDFAMAVSLFKRGLAELNRSLALLDEKAAAHSPALARYRGQARTRLFDLRDLWLRMISDCRAEIERPKNRHNNEADDSDKS